MCGAPRETTQVVDKVLECPEHPQQQASRPAPLSSCRCGAVGVCGVWLLKSLFFFEGVGLAVWLPQVSVRKGSLVRSLVRSSRSLTDLV